jgi:hypothetical protein
VWIIYEATICIPLLEKLLSLFLGQIRHMNVVNERKVQIAIVTDPSFRRQFRNVVNAHLNQISRAKPHLASARAFRHR